jgi:signal transduction histidine kinase
MVTMRARQLLQHRWVRWCLYLGFWTLLGLCNVCQHALDRLAVGKPCVWPEHFVVGCTDWFLWAAITPFILALARRFPFARSTWRRSLAVHAAGSLLAALFIATGLASVLWRAGGEPFQSWTLGKNLSELIFGPFFVFYLWIYWAIVGVRHAWEYYFKFRERDLQASKLEALLAQAQLEALKLQLQPHFLFNTLNAISALMHQDVELADRMVARLGELLRRTLDNAGSQEVPLREEVEFLQPYLEIEQARYGGRLRVRLDVEDAALDARVPNLILQPLVENAIRHGIAPRAEGGQVEVQARRRHGMLELQVRDDGPGLPSGRPLELKEGVGLGNTRARLWQLYGADHLFEMRNGPAAGLVITLAIPFRDGADAPARTPPEDHAPDPHPDRG